ncbi:hypothetical protein LTR85_004894 [Meristemomyces frigidus]|nr:hypothetical protein LTR85_004894 [Meristemomyces frigidus]
MWNPLEIIALWTGGGGRFLAFVCSVLWILAQVSCNVSANSFSFANDLMSLFPKWINIRRGTIICSIVGGWAFVPWIMAGSAYRFLDFMSGYAVFLAPIAGILTCDYWIIRGCKYDVPALYDPHGRYRYQYGVNWRAMVVMILIIVPMLPGLGYAVSPETVRVSIGITHLYDISWLYGYHASIFLYWLLNVISPARETLVAKTIPGIPEYIEGVEIEDKSSSINAQEPFEVKGGFKATEIGV